MSETSGGGRRGGRGGGRNRGRGCMQQKGKTLSEQADQDPQLQEGGAVGGRGRGRYSGWGKAPSRQSGLQQEPSLPAEERHHTDDGVPNARTGKNGGRGRHRGRQSHPTDQQERVSAPRQQERVLAPRQQERVPALRQQERVPAPRQQERVPAPRQQDQDLAQRAGLRRGRPAGEEEPQPPGRQLGHFPSSQWYRQEGGAGERSSWRNRGQGWPEPGRPSGEHRRVRNVEPDPDFWVRNGLAAPSSVGRQHRHKKEEEVVERGRGAGVVRGWAGEQSCDLRARLAEQLSCGTTECMVCLERVWQTAHTWDCSNCFQVFHLNCIKKWARTAGTGDGGWRCPGCQAVTVRIPHEYRCFCRKVSRTSISSVTDPPLQILSSHQ